MSSWIYLFSKFTSEALLFELAALSLLVAVYAGLWVLRRRRLGEEEITIKAGVVRNYLGALIADAEAMRRQLFAILQGEGLPPPHDLASPGAGPSLAGIVAAPQVTASIANLSTSDPELKEKLTQFEAQMTAQAKALEAITLEKSRLEKELQSAKAAGGGGAPGGAGDGDSKALQDKISELEGRLAEYSVIEDDLANLKRLQQENAQLKTQLSKAGVDPATVAVAAAAAAPEPEAEPLAAAESAAATPEAATPEPTPEALAEVAEAAPPVAEEATASASEASPAEDPLAALADPATAGAPPAAAETPTASSTAATPAASMGSSDADLVAEFEKMLNG